jgi:hypothetical protein
MNTKYHEEAIAEMKAGICLQEATIVQRTLDSYPVTKLENLFIFWQIYVRLRKRFILSTALISQLVILGVYLMIRYCLCLKITLPECLNCWGCILLFWAFTGLISWFAASFIFVRLHGKTEFEFPRIEPISQTANSTQSDKKEEAPKVPTEKQPFTRVWEPGGFNSGTVIRIIRTFGLEDR